MMEMREMDYSSLINILISSVEDNESSDGVREADASDIKKYFG